VTEQTLAFLAEGHRRPISDEPHELDRLRASLERDQENLRQLTESRFVHRRITDEIFTASADQLNARITALSDQIEAIERQKTGLGALKLGDPVALSAWWDEATLEDRRSVLAAAISRIIIHPAARRGGNQFDASRVDIRWKWHMYVQTEEAWLAMPEEERQRELDLERQFDEALDDHGYPRVARQS
jgi:hypothetical protein